MLIHMLLACPPYPFVFSFTVIVHTHTHTRKHLKHIRGQHIGSTNIAFLSQFFFVFPVIPIFINIFYINTGVVRIAIELCMSWFFVVCLRHSSIVSDWFSKRYDSHPCVSRRQITIFNIIDRREKKSEWKKKHCQPNGIVELFRWLNAKFNLHFCP